MYCNLEGKYIITSSEYQDSVKKVLLSLEIPQKYSRLKFVKIKRICKNKYEFAKINFY